MVLERRSAQFFVVIYHDTFMYHALLLREVLKPRIMCSFSAYAVDMTGACLVFDVSWKSPRN